MQVFVTGGTGFVGSEVVRHLLAAGHQVVALVRPGSEGKLVDGVNVRLHPGDVADQDSLPGGMAGCVAVIHLVGIIREFPGRGVTFERLHVEGTRNVLSAAAGQGIGRYLHMSANGVREDAVAQYHRTKWRAEQTVRDSPLDWTIFRPSVIFGPGSELVELLAGMIRRLPIIPVVGDGRYRMQPVAVGQVAETFLKALAMPETVGKTFHLGGPESYPFDEILDLIGRALGRKKVLKFHQPVSLVTPAIRLLEKSPHFPLTLDQLTMMLEDNICDQRPWAETFGIDPISFAQGVGGCFNKLNPNN
jgi:NADH dehydrogenase